MQKSIITFIIWKLLITQQLIFCTGEVKNRNSKSTSFPFLELNRFTDLSISEFQVEPPLVERVNSNNNFSATSNINIKNLEITNLFTEHHYDFFNYLKNINNNATFSTDTLHPTNGSEVTLASKSKIADIENKKNYSSSVKHENCSSCSLREQAKLDSLESIKRHILMRLHLFQLPNITTPIQVPNKILQNFYKSYNIASRVPHQSYYNNQLSNTTNIASLSIVTNRSTIEKVHANKAIINNTRNPSFMEYYFGSQNDEAQMLNQNYIVKANFKSRNFNFDNKRHNDELDSSNDKPSVISRTNNIYIFPTLSQAYNRSSSEVLNFYFNNNSSLISRTIIHVFLRGREWITHNNKTILEHRKPDGTIQNREKIVITVHRVFKKTNFANSTTTIKLVESVHLIPKGTGQWVQIDVKEIGKYWMNVPSSTQSIIIRGLEEWMFPFIVITDGVQNQLLSVHIEVIIKDKIRRKRSTSLDCLESENEKRCCRYPLKVNFTSFDWHFVVAPSSFDAYFCNGECKVGYLEQYTHTHIASLTTSASPCCSPTKMSALSLLYFNVDRNLVLSTIPNMSVEKCSCS